MVDTLGSLRAERDAATAALRDCTALYETAAQHRRTAIDVIPEMNTLVAELRAEIAADRATLATVKEWLVQARIDLGSEKERNEVQQHELLRLRASMAVISVEWAAMGSVGRAELVNEAGADMVANIELAIAACEVKS